MERMDWFHLTFWGCRFNVRCSCDGTCRGRIVNVGFMLHLAPMLEPLTWLGTAKFTSKAPCWDEPGVFFECVPGVFNFLPWILNHGFFLVHELLPQHELGPWLTVACLEAWWSGWSCMEFTLYRSAYDHPTHGRQASASHKHYHVDDQHAWSLLAWRFPGNTSIICLGHSDDE